MSANNDEQLDDNELPMILNWYKHGTTQYFPTSNMKIHTSE